MIENKKYIIDEKNIPESLKRQLGAFVTLKINNNLRGCIGRFISTDPLYEVVQASALSSAFEDPALPFSYKGRIQTRLILRLPYLVQ